MFIKCYERETETFNVGDDFLIDIVTYLGNTEVWIYHKHYGIKELMFGVLERDYLKLLEMIENDLDEEKKYYEQMHMDTISEIEE